MMVYLDKLNYIAYLVISLSFISVAPLIYFYLLFQSSLFHNISDLYRLNHSCLLLNKCKTACTAGVYSTGISNHSHSEFLGEYGDVMQLCYYLHHRNKKLTNKRFILASHTLKITLLCLIMLENKHT